MFFEGIILITILYVNIYVKYDMDRQDDLDNHSDQCNPNNDEYDGYQDD